MSPRTIGKHNNKLKGVMTEHVAKVLEQIDGEVDRLHELRAGLVKWFGDGGPVGPALPANGARPHPVPLPRERVSQARNGSAKPRVARLPAAPKSGGKRGALLLEQAQKLVGLAEPFGSDEVMKALGAEYKAASNWFTRASAKGWVKRVGTGQYKRTAKFPGAGKAPAETPAGEPGEPSLQEKLDKALKDRDAAMARGNDTLARILQDKVTMLQKKIDGE